MLSGDTPLLTTELLQELVDTHRREQRRRDRALLRARRPPLLRSGRPRRRTAPSTPSSRPPTRRRSSSQLTECNSSIYVFRTELLWPALDRLEPHNAQGELYLTDAVRDLVEHGERVVAHVAADAAETEGVNTRVELAAAAATLRDRINSEHMLGGRGDRRPGVDLDRARGRDRGRRGDPAVHDPPRRARKSLRGRRVGSHVVAIDAEIGAEATVGPFCYLRPGTVLGPRTKAGAFVEIKKSTIGQDTKVPHLSYIGDAEIGEGTNIGAGSITANFPHRAGQPKGKTTIGSNVRVAVDTMFVAPVTVGDDAWTAAGAVITDDVPDNALAGFPPKQVNKEGRGGKRDD